MSTFIVDSTGKDEAFTSLQAAVDAASRLIAAKREKSLILIRPN